MADFALPAASDGGKLTSTLIDSGKNLVDKGKKLGGALSGLNAAQEDARAIAKVQDDPNLTPAQKALQIAHIIRDRLPAAEAGQTIPPLTPGVEGEHPPLADNPATPTAPIIQVYVDP